MAFVSMIMVFLLIIIAILALLLIAGLIFLIIGIINKRKPKYVGKKSPIVCIVIGVLLLILPVGTIAVTLIGGVTSSVLTMIKRTDYESVTDKWRNERVHDDDAAEEAIEELLTAADAGDREQFKKVFTPNIQQSEKFDAAVDNFFDTYPVGLSQCELDGGIVGSSSSYNYGHNIQTGSTDYSCTLNGEWYYIRMKFCFDNTDSPDEVGVTLFYIENLEANALDRSDEYYEDKYIDCTIKSDKEVTARLIKGKAFIFAPHPERAITEEQMRDYLKYYNDDLSQLSRVIGMPNVTKNSYNSAGIEYYYELCSENGEPRYAEINADYPSGNFLYGWVCSDKEIFYDKELFSNPY